jgi:hypothetical protein
MHAQPDVMGKQHQLAPPAAGWQAWSKVLPGIVKQEIEMAKTHLLQAVCTVAMLAAVPALAQRPESGMTGPNGAPNPAAQQPMPNSGSTAPADNAGSASTSSPGDTGSASTTPSHPKHRSAMARSARGHTDRSQDAAVDQLNDQSYQAAQQGQAFSAGGAPSGGPGAMPPSGAMPPAGASGGMNGMSGGTTPGSGTPASGGQK